MAYEYQSFATLGVNLNRQNYGALDISQVFTSQADLNYYISKGAITEGVSSYWYDASDAENIKKIVPYPYAGQYVALVNNTTREVTAYILAEKEDGTFETKEVGKTPVGDDKSIVVDDEGVISIKGFDALTAAEDAFLPRVKWVEASEGVEAHAEIEWVSVSAVVEGDGNTITKVTSSDGSVSVSESKDAESDTITYDLKVEHPEYAVKVDERAEGDTSTTYHLTKDGTNVDVEIVVPDAYNDTALAGRVEAVEGDIETINETLKAKADAQALTDGLALKANAADVYTKDEADAAHNGLTTEIGKKANASDVYTKTEIDGKVETINGAIAEKAAAANVYTKSEVYTKGETDTAIAAAVTAADHLKRKIVTKYEDIQAYVDSGAGDADQYIYMVPTVYQYTEESNKYDEYIYINGVIEPVGTWAIDLKDYVSEAEFAEYLKAYYTSKQVDDILAAYATTAAVTETIGNELKLYYTIEQIGGLLEKYYTAEEVDALVNTTIAGYYKKSEIDATVATLATKQELTEGLAGKVDNDDLADYYTKTEANGLLNDKADKSTTYTKDEVNNLLDGKVDDADLNAYYTKTEADDKFVAQEEDKSLVSDTEIAKLATVEENAEENYVKSVDSHFEVSEAGELTLKTVAINEVDGLEDALDDKVTRQYFTVTDEETGESTTVEGALLSPIDKEKLDALVIGDNGVEISGKVNASNVEGLNEWITQNRDKIDGLYSSTTATNVNKAIADLEALTAAVATNTTNIANLTTKVSSIENNLTNFVLATEYNQRVGAIENDITLLKNAVTWTTMTE